MVRQLGKKMLREFLALESAGGLILIIAAAAAIILVNSPAGFLYEDLLSLPVILGVGAVEIDKPLLLWINDGLMAIFFFLVGLEIKRESISGELSTPSAVALPAAAAVGGMAVPALIYVWVNWGDPVAMQGWAIPAATDIAFALGVLALLGSRAPVALKVFLLSVAIIDDLGAILIIAFFYTSQISFQAMMGAGAALIVLFLLNRAGVRSLSFYILAGIVLWVSVLKSGVHATLAGVVLAFFIPEKPDEEGDSPLRSLEHDLHGTVAFVILPVFAFANAGVRIETFSIDAFLDPVPLGVALGLFLGKQIGVFSFVLLMVKTRLADLPSGVTWAQVYGVSLLTGVGFTMSLFIGSLAFGQAGNEVADERLGILLGSFLSAVAGYVVLRLFTPKSAPSDKAPGGQAVQQD
jgi:NhaA family Na+:H+ antiporter